MNKVILLIKILNLFLNCIHLSRFKISFCELYNFIFWQFMILDVTREKKMYAVVTSCTKLSN